MLDIYQPSPNHNLPLTSPNFLISPITTKTTPIQAIYLTLNHPTQLPNQISRLEEKQEMFTFSHTLQLALQYSR